MGGSISTQESVYFETCSSNMMIAAASLGAGNCLGMVAATAASTAIWSQDLCSLFSLHAEYFELLRDSLKQ